MRTLSEAEEGGDEDDAEHIPGENGTGTVTLFQLLQKESITLVDALLAICSCSSFWCVQSAGERRGCQDHGHQTGEESDHGQYEHLSLIRKVIQLSP